MRNRQLYLLKEIVRLLGRLHAQQSGGVVVPRAEIEEVCRTLKAEWSEMEELQ